MEVVDVIVRDAVRKQLATGQHNRALGDQFGIKQAARR
jgi:hypothetical protein